MFFIKRYSPPKSRQYSFNFCQNQRNGCRSTRRVIYIPYDWDYLSLGWHFFKSGKFSELGCKQCLNRCFEQDIFRTPRWPPLWKYGEPLWLINWKHHLLRIIHFQFQDSPNVFLSKDTAPQNLGNIHSIFCQNQRNGCRSTRRVIYIPYDWDYLSLGWHFFKSGKFSELGCKQCLNRCFEQDIFRTPRWPPFGNMEKNLISYDISFIEYHL